MTTYPDETNTGVPDGTVLEESGGMTITTEGTTISGLDISGTVYINADNVTIESSKITSAGYYCIQIAPGVTGTVIQDCEIDGVGTGNAGSNGIGGQGTFLRNNIYNVENGITLQGDNSYIEGNYIHDLNASGSAHYDGIQIDGGVSGATITGNTIINQQGSVSAIMIDNYFGPVSDIVVDGNLLAGGGFTVYSDAQFNNYSITDIEFTNNHMGEGTYGYTMFRGNSPTYEGNVNDGDALVDQLGHQVADDSTPVVDAPATRRPLTVRPLTVRPRPAAAAATEALPLRPRITAAPPPATAAARPVPAAPAAPVPVRAAPAPAGPTPPGPIRAAPTRAAPTPGARIPGGGTRTISTSITASPGTTGRARGRAAQPRAGCPTHRTRPASAAPAPAAAEPRRPASTHWRRRNGTGGPRMPAAGITTTTSGRDRRTEMTPPSPQERELSRPQVATALSRCRGAFQAVAIFSGIINILMLTGPLFMLQVYDRVLSSHSVPTLIALLSVVTCLFGFLALLDVLRSRILTRAGEAFDAALRPFVFRLMTNSNGPGSRDGMQPVRDLDVIRQFLGSPGPAAIFDMPWVPFYLGIVFLFHMWLGLAATVGAVVLCVFAITIEVATRRPGREAAGEMAERNAIGGLCRQHVDDLEIMGMMGTFRERWHHTHSAALARTRVAADISSSLSALSKASRLLMQSVILAIGAYLVIRNEATAGVMIAASITSSRALAPIEQIVAHWRTFLASRQAYNRLKAYDDVAEPEKAYHALPRPRHELTARDLMVWPNGSEEPTLTGVEFSLRAGQALAVIGPSGSGKSSLANGIVGKWATSAGSLRIDGATLDQWDRAELARHIGHMGQDVHLFPGTISENISRFAEAPDEEAVLAAAQRAGVARAHPQPAGRLQHAGRRQVHQSVGRSAPARRAGSSALRQPVPARSRRTELEPQFGRRGGAHQGHQGSARGWQHRRGHRPPPERAGRRRRRAGHRRRTAGGVRAERRGAGPRARPPGYREGQGSMRQPHPREGIHHSKPADGAREADRARGRRSAPGRLYDRVKAGLLRGRGGNGRLRTRWREGADPAGSPLPPRQRHQGADGAASLKSSIRRNVTLGLVAIGALVGVAGGWSALASLSGAVIAPGRIVVDSDVKQIQHPYGGIVTAIPVSDGDQVHAGDVLFRLDETITRSELDIVQKQLAELRARAARLVAERDGLDDVQEPELSQTTPSPGDLESAVAAERQLFRARRTAREGKTAQLREQVAQLEQETTGVQAQIEAKSSEIKLVEKELDDLQGLLDKGLVQASRITGLKREMARLNGERGALVAKTAEIQGRTAETKLKILQIAQDFQSEIATELRDVTSRIGEFEEREVAAKDKLSHVDVRAPIDGVVYESNVHTIGGVIRAGETTMKIVPLKEALTIEAKVSPQNIDQLRPGQKARVRFTSLDQRSTPELEGSVQRIAPNSSQDERSGVSYYSVRINMPEEQIARLGDVQLLPGMPVEAFVQTSARTPLNYLLKPLGDQLHHAMREN